MRSLTGWLALITAVALAVGGGAITEDLRTLVGPRADQVVAAARIVAALMAAATGAILAKKGGSDAAP